MNKYLLGYQSTRDHFTQRKHPVIGLQVRLNSESNSVVNKAFQRTLEAASTQTNADTYRHSASGPSSSFCTSYWSFVMQIRPNNSPSTGPAALIRCSETIIQSQTIGTCSTDTRLVRTCFISVRLTSARDLRRELCTLS